MPYYAIFEGTVLPGKEDVSDNYYTTLEAHLRKQSGLVEEVNYANDSPRDSMLLSSWIDDQALEEWQKLPIHLRIQKLARENVYSSYRIRLGWEGSSTTFQTTNRSGQVMVLYQAKKDDKFNASLTIQDLLWETSSADVALAEMLDHSVWWTDTHVLHVTGWPSEKSALQFERAVKRVSGDYLRRVTVSRDYTKVDRGEAPSATEVPDL